MRKKFILDTKNKRGITLISLVITIIVLLILAESLKYISGTRSFRKIIKLAKGA